MKRILIFGMGRSGTSFLANFLALSGVYSGGLTGKYEHPEGRRINGGILEEYGARAGLPYGTLPDEEIHAESRVGEVFKFIEKMDDECNQAGFSQWFYKDPRSTVLRSLWQDHFDIFISTFRKPEEVITSYCKKGWVIGDDARTIMLNYWCRFNRDLLRAWDELEGSEKPHYMLDFNGDVRIQVESLCRKLNIEPNEKALSLFDDEKKHYHASGEVFTPHVQTIYDRLIYHANLKEQ
jgi:hypothetical protein